MKSDIAIRNEIIEYTQAIENHKALVAILKFIKLMYKNTAGPHGKMWENVREKAKAAE